MDEAALQLLTVMPTTVAGVAALLMHAADFEAGGFGGLPDDIVDEDDDPGRGDGRKEVIAPRLLEGAN